jgi:Fur family transcriptional regulator, peroxide stress response regulator
MERQAIPGGDAGLNQKLAAGGFRLTPQREKVYGVLRSDRDHPTAEQVYARAKQVIPDISLATVYNCLDALVKTGLVREVVVDRSATRYCSNMREHHHFHCNQCGHVFDVDATETGVPEVRLPRGFHVLSAHLSLSKACARNAPGKRRWPEPFLL